MRRLDHWRYPLSSLLATAVYAIVASLAPVGWTQSGYCPGVTAYCVGVPPLALVATLALVTLVTTWGYAR